MLDLAWDGPPGRDEWRRLWEAAALVYTHACEPVLLRLDLHGDADLGRADRREIEEIRRRLGPRGWLYVLGDENGR